MRRAVQRGLAPARRGGPLAQRGLWGKPRANWRGPRWSAIGVGMFEGWENFYLIVGPSAAALIGLMFVVMTLTAGRQREDTERGKHLYTSPIVWHLGVVLALSGAAVAPTIDARLFGIAS